MTEVKVSLPMRVGLDCKTCSRRFEVSRESIAGRGSVFCPFCGRQMELYDSLEPHLRRRLYQAVRDFIEGRVHEQQRIDEDHYFEDEGNIRD